MHKQSSTLSSRNHSMHWSKEMRSRTGIVFVSLYPTISIRLLFFFNEPAVELPIIWISHAKTGVKTKKCPCPDKSLRSLQYTCKLPFSGRAQVLPSSLILARSGTDGIFLMLEMLTSCLFNTPQHSGIINILHFGTLVCCHGGPSPVE